MHQMVFPMVFEPVQGFHPGALGGLWVITAAGVVEKRVVGPWISNELIVVVFRPQRRFQGQHSGVDPRVVPSLETQLE